MRVIAGSAKGRRLKTPATGTRPMTDRMKESVFSALGDLKGALVLDLYAGSGALGLEALSRGAKKATFIDNARDAIVKLEQNIEVTGFKRQSEITWADVPTTLARRADKRLDLIFVDPPYSANPTSVRADLESIVLGGYLANEGRIVLHRPAKERRIQPLGLTVLWQRDYGQSQIVVYAHEDE